MTDQPAITDEAVDAYLRSGARRLDLPADQIDQWIANLRPAIRKHVREDLGAAAPHIAAQAVRDVERGISAQVDELRASYRTGDVGIEYINGMEDAANGVRKAVEAIERALATGDAR